MFAHGFSLAFIHNLVGKFGGHPPPTAFVVAVACPCPNQLDIDKFDNYTTGCSHKAYNQASNVNCMIICLSTKFVKNSNLGVSNLYSKILDSDYCKVKVVEFWLSIAFERN
ncbi:hypothetical protein ACFE04_026229 [Oxalis oulophora]